MDLGIASSERGLWALKGSLVGLGVTAAFQVVIVVTTGSVALLADTVHNLGDALSAVPLGIAFQLPRRPRSARFPSVFAAHESIRRGETSAAGDH